MATNIDVTLKRYNGTDYDLILPTTHLGQIYTDNTLVTTLGNFLTDTYINVDKIGAVSGLATLDANQKLTNSQIPDFLFGGLKFGGNINSADDQGNYLTTLTQQEFIDRIIQPAFNNYNGSGNPKNVEGLYYVLREGSLSFETTSNQPPSMNGLLSNGLYFRYGFEAKEESHGPYAPQTLTIEANDWIVITKHAGGDGSTASTPIHYWLSIVNNQYGTASTGEYGIVKYSDATTVTGMTGNDVITEGILAGLIGTETGDIAAGDHLHDDRYYTETEIGNYFDGTTPITGYDKIGWDAAYGWGDHSLVGYLTEETLSDLVDVTLTDLQVNSILRYDGNAWVNDGNFKPILYGTGQTSSITGAIIIETD